MPLALSASAIAAVAAAVLIGLSAGVCRAQGAATTTTTTTTTTSNEPAFIKNLHITGFLQNTSSTWVNSGAIEYNLHSAGEHPVGLPPLNRNSLAAERQLLQIDVNDDFTENDSMFLRSWFVYEPSYPWETNCGQQYGSLRLPPGIPTAPTIAGVRCSSSLAARS
jgi:hypothetical protein